jgi:hypothetical protein
VKVRSSYQDEIDASEGGSSRAPLVFVPLPSPSTSSSLLLFPSDPRRLSGPLSSSDRPGSRPSLPPARDSPSPSLPLLRQPANRPRLSLEHRTSDKQYSTTELLNDLGQGKASLYHSLGRRRSSSQLPSTQPRLLFNDWWSGRRGVGGYRTAEGVLCRVEWTSTAQRKKLAFPSFCEHREEGSH